jgi:glycosyltransferase involved in cell wall biosynthesis
LITIKNIFRYIIPSDSWELLHKIRLRLKQNQYKSKLEISIPNIPSKGIYLNYGGVLIQHSNGIVHGGKVKLMQLNERFPESSDCFNILYLVSSAFPSYALELVDWAKRHGAKFIWNQNGVAYPAWAGESYESTNKVMKKLIHSSDYVIYQSEFCRQSADRYLGEIDRPWKIIYNGVDTDVFSPSKIPLPLNPWVLLTTGSHRQSDKIDLVLTSIALIKQNGTDVRLIIAGRLDWNDAEKEIRFLIGKHGLQNEVVLLSPFTQNQAPEIYRQAHAFLHIQYKDASPTVILEAMACGLPIIGSKSGGMPELVGKEGGILIDVLESWDQIHYPSPERIADAVNYIFSDLPVWRQKARQRAIRCFDKKSWIDRHGEIFQTILPHHG